MLPVRHMLLAFHRYAEFAGRSSRREYWMFQLLLALCFLVLHGMVMLARAMANATVVAVVELLVGLLIIGTLVPYLSVTVRRLHDFDRSGWYVMVTLIPILGPLMLFLSVLAGGDAQPNRFGDVPKE